LERAELEALARSTKTEHRQGRGWMVHLFHLTCCFLVMRYEKISLTALSTNAVEIGGRSRRRRPRIIDVMAPAVG